MSLQLPRQEKLARLRPDVRLMGAGRPIESLSPRPDEFIAGDSIDDSATPNERRNQLVPGQPTVRFLTCPLRRPDLLAAR